MSATVWIMVLLLSGTGKAAVVVPLEYQSVEECIESGKGMQGRDKWASVPEFVCVPGISKAEGGAA